MSSASRGCVFFASTASITNELGAISNSVWSSAVAFWNLRHQVQLFVQEAGKINHQDLHTRFVEKSGIVSADLRTTCLDWTWDQTRSQLAKGLLFELCALYEAWLDDVVPRSIPASEVKSVIKQLQFPTELVAGIPRWGFRKAIVVVSAHESPTMRSEIFPTLAGHRKNSWGFMEQLLTAYRYFKECRNTFIHSGGIAGENAVKAYQALLPIDPLLLCLKNRLRLPIIALGDPVQLELADVVAFSGIIHRLIFTLDAALSITSGSEAELLGRLTRTLSRGRFLPAQNSAKRERAIIALIRKAGLPNPVSVVLIEKLLVSNGFA